MSKKTEFKVAAIIPAYKVTAHIVELVEKIGPEVEKIYIVDDKCPDNSGDFAKEKISDSRVSIIYNDLNLGVGGAVMAGLQQAYNDGIRVGVKLDGDGQMDPSILHKFIRPIIAGQADYTKGNRFFNPSDIENMPTGRIVGNAVLSFVSKFSTGYWNVFDPTNGYLAIDLRLLNYLSLSKINKRYFFETDILFRCNLIKAKVVDIPMTAIYEDEVSNLKFGKEIGRFMWGHSKNFIKRIYYNYFLRDFNIASLELLIGLGSLSFGLTYGFIKVGGESAESAGTVMIAALPIMIGVMLLLSFLNYDIQQTPRQAISPSLDEISH